MTPEEKERAAIVAWLRANVAECLRLEKVMDDQGSHDDADHMAFNAASQTGIANAIERNAHNAGESNDQ